MYVDQPNKIDFIVFIVFIEGKEVCRIFVSHNRNCLPINPPPSPTVIWNPGSGLSLLSGVVGDILSARYLWPVQT